MDYTLYFPIKNPGINKKPRIIYRFFSILPFFSDLNGEWVIEKNSEIKDMSTFRRSIRFYFDNWSKFFVYPLGGLALATELYLNQLEKLNHGKIPINAVFKSGGGNFTTPFITLPQYIFLSISLLLVINQMLWKLEDSEMKIINSKLSTKGNVYEIDDMYLAASPLKNLFSVIFGLSGILWFYNQIMNNVETDPNNIFSVVSLTEIVRNMVLLFFTISFMLWLLGIIYHQSGIHEDIVNAYRGKIKERRDIAEVEVYISRY